MARKKSPVDVPAEPKATRAKTGSASRTPATSRAGKAAAPTREAVGMRAYEIYLARGQQQGSAEQDWFQAERELAEPVR